MVFKSASQLELRQGIDETSETYQYLFSVVLEETVNSQEHRLLAKATKHGAQYDVRPSEEDILQQPASFSFILKPALHRSLRRC